MSTRFTVAGTMQEAAAKQTGNHSTEGLAEIRARGEEAQGTAELRQASAASGRRMLGVGTQIAIGIVARNEESGIGATLDSLFAQSLFRELNHRGWKCEILCLANACTDRTEEVVAKIFEAQGQQHPDREAFQARVTPLGQGGKLNAWNQFVHSLSAREARFLFLMDADILIHQQKTLWNMVLALENDAQAHIAVDRPCKDIQFKRSKTPLDYLSLAASRLTSSADAQLCGQLYCIRAEVARNIYLPKDLPACEDGFIKAIVCTDFLTHPSAPGRIRVADGAAHIFEAYTSPATVVKNQKRQIIGQTILHILIDNYLKDLPLSERTRLGETLQEKDRSDPAWLRRLIDQHLQRARHWWRLYPGMGALGFKRLKRLKAAERLLCLPAAMAASSVALVSGPLAFGVLKAGGAQYWPQARRQGMEQLKPKS